MKKSLTHTPWFLVGLICAAVGAPHALILKVATLNFDPFLFNALRYGLLAIVTIPLLVIGWKKITRSGLISSIVVGLLMSIATMCYLISVQSSQASYVAILGLAAPITLIVLSVYFEREKIQRNGYIGIGLASLGALLIVGLPWIMNHQSAGFWPLATMLMLVNILSNPLAVIISKSTNDQGMPLHLIMIISAWITSTMSLLAFGFVGQPVSLASFTPQLAIGIIYSGLVIGFALRFTAIMMYERVGSVATSTLSYITALLAVLLPIAILGERLSLGMIVGGACVLIGAFIVERHQPVDLKHWHSLKHH